MYSNEAIQDRSTFANRIARDDTHTNTHTVQQIALTRIIRQQLCECYTYSDK
jgi:hypothetical protein